MKKKYLIIVIIVFLILPLIKILKPKTELKYEVNDFIVMQEIVNKKTHLTIKRENKTYYYLFDSKNNKKIIEEINYYEDDDYSCIFISFIDGSNSNDLLCYKDGLNYYFSTINDPSNILKTQYQSLVDNGKIKIKTNDIYNVDNVGLYKIYKNNIYDNLGFALTNYKGLYILKNNEIKEINLFDNDVYEQKIKIFTENKYIIADYNQLYDFDKFYIVDLNSGKIEQAKLKKEISFNSEIIMIDDDIIYLYDKDSQINYKFNIISKTLNQVNEIPIKEKELLGQYEIIKDTETNYYLLKDSILYKSILKSENQIFEMFSLENKQNIKIGEKYICWLEKNDINCYYNNSFNIIATNNEFSFNNTLNYQVFEIK